MKLFHQAKPKKAKSLLPSVSKFTKFNEQCVCQICTCGRHHCPVHPRNNKGTYNTTFADSYKPWNIKKQGLCKFDRPYQNFTYDPNMLRSNYQIDYIPHDLPEKEQKKKDDAAGSGQPFNATSDYRLNYIKHPPQMKRKKSVEKYKVPPGRFDMNSTYKDDYLKHPYTAEGPLKIGTKDGPEGNIFTGNSVYNQDYKPHEVKMPEKPNKYQQKNIYGHPGTAEKDSIYRSDYKGYEVRENDQCPIYEMPQRPNQLGPGKSHLNYDAHTNYWY